MLNFFEKGFLSRISRCFLTWYGNCFLYGIVYGIVLENCFRELF